MKPDCRQRKDKDYFREIVRKTNLSQCDIACRIGVTSRTMRNYMRNGAPYVVQFAVECLLYASD